MEWFQGLASTGEWNMELGLVLSLATLSICGQSAASFLYIQCYASNENPEGESPKPWRRVYILPHVMDELSPFERQLHQVRTYYQAWRGSLTLGVVLIPCAETRHHKRHTDPERT